MPLETSTQGKEQTLEWSDKLLRTGDILSSCGFILNLVWHYLILFSPALVGPGVYDSKFLMGRQVFLYASLAVSFVLVGLLLGRAHRLRTKLLASVPGIVVLGLLSSLVSAACAFIPQEYPMASYAATAMLGFVEAFMMFLWLKVLAAEQGNMLRSFSVSMMIAGLLSLVVFLFQDSVLRIVVSLLPLVSSFALAQESVAKRDAIFSDDFPPVSERASGRGAKGKAEDRDAGSADGRAVPDRSDRMQGENVRAAELTWPKDISQGRPRREKDGEAAGNSPSNWRRRFFSLVFNMLPPMIFALVLGFTQGLFVHQDILLLMANDPMVLIGIFAAGILIWLLPSAYSKMFRIELMHRYSMILLIAGILGLMVLWDSHTALVLSEIAILAGFNLFDFGVMALGLSKQGIADDNVHVIEGGRPVVYVSLLLGMLLGYFAVNNVPGDLHDATTVLCALSVLVIACSSIVPYFSFIVLHKRSAQTDGPFSSESTARDAEVAVFVPVSPLLDEEQHVAPREKHISPWRSTCQYMAKLYQLTPREKEIFLMLAKGRNAAYIQEKLMISPHTAKTHISNIYRKFDVHALQELLDLIEGFMEAERRANGLD